MLEDEVMDGGRVVGMGLRGGTIAVYNELQVSYPLVGMAVI